MEVTDNTLKNLYYLALLPELVSKWFSRQTVATSITQTDPT